MQLTINFSNTLPDQYPNAELGDLTPHDTLKKLLERAVDGMRVLEMTTSAQGQMTAVVTTTQPPFDLLENINQASQGLSIAGQRIPRADSFVIGGP